MARRRHVLLLIGSALAGVAGCASSSDRKPAPNTANAPPEDKDPRLLFERGRAFAEAGDLVRAEQYLGAALKAGADERAVVPVLLRVCIAARHYRYASEVAELTLARMPDDPRLRLVVGALYVQIGNPGLAREHLERAARELATDADVQFAVGVVFRDDLADRAAADRYFREYLRLQPNGGHAAEARASVMERVDPGGAS
jgi:tetratricopeptide (TPR) repeat protein